MYYQLKAIRKNTKPPIWRRISVPSDITFAQLAVILESILEFPYSDSYEFEFYTRKVRLSEFAEKKENPSDFYYTYLHSPDTYINGWMESEKAFSFGMNGGDDSLPKYRIEIEKLLENVEVKDGDTYRKTNFPVIMKQVSAPVDLFWTDPHVVNTQIRQSCFFEYGPEEYPSTRKILEQMKQGKGLTACASMHDRDIHTKKSANASMKELGEMLKVALANKSGENSSCREAFMDQGNDSYAYKPISYKKPARRECKMEAFLKSYKMEELYELAEELEVTVTAKTKAKIAHELARCLLDAPVMRARLLRLDEKQLDAWESVIESGPFVPSADAWDMLFSAEDLKYLCYFSDGTVQVPDEVIYLYDSLKRRGYREYHNKASWLLKCIKVASYLYMSVPLEVLYQMYVRNKRIKANFMEFREILDTIPSNVSECVLLDNNRLVFKNIVKTGSYRRLESMRRGDFYIPDKKEIEIIARDTYPSYEPAYQALCSFFRKTLGHEDDFSVYLCQLAFQIFSSGGLLSDYMDMLHQMEFEFRSEKNVNDFASILMNVNNETRMAELCGHKPNEMAKLRANTAKAMKPAGGQKGEKRIYPNEPCPCGSGKKYKKCCGR